MMMLLLMFQVITPWCKGNPTTVSTMPPVPTPAPTTADDLLETIHQNLQEIQTFIKSIQRDEFKEIDILENNVKDYWDSYGDSIAVDGDYLVVGIPHDDDDPEFGVPHSQGGIIIYEWNGNEWALDTKFTAQQQDKWYGASVAISGDTIVVGAPRADVVDVNTFTNAGEVFVYKNTGTEWVYNATLTPSNIKDNLFFGWSVDVSDDRIVVGSKAVDQNDRDSVYVFEFIANNWNENILQPSAGYFGNYFGLSVSIDGDLIAVGAPKYSYPYRKRIYLRSYYNILSGTSPGTVFVYKYDNIMSVWSIVSPLLETNNQAEFGFTVAVSNNHIVVGNPYYGLYNGGKVLIYEYSDINGVTETAQLRSSDIQRADWYGYSVAIKDDYVVVGAPQDGKYNAGSVYVYEMSGYRPKEYKLRASDKKKEDNFGWSVAINKNVIAVGAPFKGRFNAGGAYVYEIGKGSAVAAAKCAKDGS